MYIEFHVNLYINISAYTYILLLWEKQQDHPYSETTKLLDRLAARIEKKRLQDLQQNAKQTTLHDFFQGGYAGAWATLPGRPLDKIGHFFPLRSLLHKH